jgi:uncharacterized repeat protein (TIGR01451 family)
MCKKIHFTIAIILGFTVLLTEATQAAESCYAASDSGNRLVLVVDRTDGSTSIDVGPLGVPNIEALAKDPVSGEVYGANANQLGTINLDTGAFTATASTFGTALAANGNLTSNRTLNDVDSLAFDLTSGFLYGVQNASGPEILFRINPATGALVPGAMGGNDYLLIGTSGSIDDLAIDQAGTMFASSANNLYTINFAAVGTTNASLVGAFGGPNDMEGLSTDVPGNLIGTTGANNSNSAFNNSLWTINKATGAASNQVSIPIGGDYEGVTCALADIDLNLSKTVALSNDADASGTVTEGDQVTYSITVVNNDVNQIASGVEVTDNISTLTGLTFVSSSSTKATANPYASATGVWSVGSIPANTSYQLSLVYSVEPAAVAGSITNTVQITQSANPDPDSEPNNDDGDQSEDDEDNASITVIGAPTITKSFSTDPINSGASTSLTLTLTNPNATALTAATVTDTYPVQIVNATPANAATTCGGTVTATNAGPSVVLTGGTIPASGSCTVSVEVTSTIVGTHLNISGEVGTTEAPDSETANDNLTVNASPTSDLSITKDDSSLSYTPGSAGVYTIIVTNNGPDDVSGATIADDLPNGVTITSVWTCTSSSINSSCNTTPSTTDPISIDADIVNGDTITVTVPVQFSADMGDY